MEKFRLVNRPPARPKLVIDQPKDRQRLLFTGLNCLRGQLDLFDPSPSPELDHATAREVSPEKAE